jgi:hypothetical protein
MTVEFERGGDAEVAATATQAPEKILVLIFARGEQLSIRRHQID